MKERPILMSAPMVQALLRKVNPKTVTRRIINPQPEFVTGRGGRVYHPEKFKKLWESISGTGVGDGYPDCLYGSPGDRLWVRETFYAFGQWKSEWDPKKTKLRKSFLDRSIEYQQGYRYAENPPDFIRSRFDVELGWHKRTSLLMPRAASRITLEIAGIRAERVQEITMADAIAEGVESEYTGEEGTLYRNYLSKSKFPSFGMPSVIGSYATLYDALNGPGSWDKNEWVWVITLQRMPPAP